MTFVSYSRADKDLVLPLVSLLRGSGLEVFVDVHDLEQGEDWAEQVTEAVARSERLVLFWSKRSSSSENVARELALALATPGCKIVPVPLDSTPLPAALIGIHRSDELARTFRWIRRAKTLWHLALASLVSGMLIAPAIYRPSASQMPAESIAVVRAYEDSPSASLGPSTPPLALDHQNAADRRNGEHGGSTRGTATESEYAHPSIQDNEPQGKPLDSLRAPLALEPEVPELKLSIGYLADVYDLERDLTETFRAVLAYRAPAALAPEEMLRIESRFSFAGASGFSALSPQVRCSVPWELYALWHLGVRQTNIPCPLKNYVQVDSWWIEIEQTAQWDVSDGLPIWWFIDGFYSRCGDLDLCLDGERHREGPRSAARGAEFEFSPFREWLLDRFFYAEDLSHDASGMPAGTLPGGPSSVCNARRLPKACAAYDLTRQTSKGEESEPGQEWSPFTLWLPWLGAALALSVWWSGYLGGRYARAADLVFRNGSGTNADP